MALHLSAAISRQVAALENIVCVLNREVERSAVTLEAFTHQHILDQEKIENLSTKLCHLERVIGMRDLQLSETEQLVRELQSCTYDGIFVWKISEFSRRRQEAVAGRTPAMFSPGEHKCLELFLWGDDAFSLTFGSCFIPRSILLQQIWLQNVSEAVPERRWDRARNAPFALLCRHEGQV